MFQEVVLQFPQVDKQNPSLTLRVHPGTRSREIQQITRWVMSSDSTKVLWLSGPGGFGKSILSTTLADSFESLQRLGAFYFFNRDVDEQSSAAGVIRTLSYQLALSDSRLATKLSEVLSTHAFICGSHARRQFSELITNPLHSLSTSTANGPIVVILDALDECGVHGCQALLSVLAEGSWHLPPYIQILITSRLSDDIQKTFERLPHVMHQDLQWLTGEPDRDIIKFITDTLALFSRDRYPPLSPDWPEHDSIFALATNANGLFIWAETAIKEICSSDDPARCLKELTNPSLATLPHLYTSVLQSHGIWEDRIFCEIFIKESAWGHCYGQNPLALHIH